jgi:4-diphosphocytidyl-2C-methyl-D-erythritol kinase
VKVGIPAAQSGEPVFEPLVAEAKMAVFMIYNNSSSKFVRSYPQIYDKFYSNIYPTRCNDTPFILSGNCSTCFGWYHHPSSEAQTTVSTASDICHTVIAICRCEKYQMLEI